MGSGGGCVWEITVGSGSGFTPPAPPALHLIPLIPPASITAADPFPARAPGTQTDTR